MGETTRMRRHAIRKMAGLFMAALVLCALIVLGPAVGAVGNTLYVDGIGIGPNTYETLQEAADAAADGDTIVLKIDDAIGATFAGTYTAEGLTIRGDGAQHSVYLLKFNGDVDLTLLWRILRSEESKGSQTIMAPSH